MSDVKADLPQGTPPSDGKDPAPDWSRRLTGVGQSVGRALLVPTLALFLALVVGAVIIMATDIDAWAKMDENAWGALRDMLRGVGRSYKALFDGAFGDVRAISETLFTASPLILAGLGVGLGFRAGLFNIGARGQMFFGGLAALWVALYVDLPGVVLIPLAIAASILGGGLWGGLAGFLRARTGAHEVITTIMLNSVAALAVLYALKTPLFQAEGVQQPQSEHIPEAARLGTLFGADYRVNIGLLIAFAAVAGVYWLLFKSSLGFEFRAAGFSPTASTYAGMNVAFLYTAVMFISGGLAGVAGAAMTLGLPPYVVFDNFPGNIGFDAISLALLGRSHPVGILWAGLLFGALTAGGRVMQAAAGASVDLVVVMQALIVVFIAAPELVRAIFRLKRRGEETAQITQGWGA